MRDTVHAGVVAVAALSLRISFALPAILAVGVVVDWYIENLCANGEPAFFFLFMMKAPLARKILAVLVRKFVFACVFIHCQLFLCPVPFERFPDWKLVAAAVPEVNEEPQHNPAGPGNPPNAMGEHDQKENAADDEKTQCASYG